MNRFLTLLLACLLIVVGLTADVIAQDTPKTQASATDGEITRSQRLKRKFEYAKEVRLEIGAANDHVHELQASLNLHFKKHEDRKIELANPIEVGPPLGLGNLDEPEKKSRLIYNVEYDKAFQIGGDWEPCDEKGKPLKSDELIKTRYLKAPEKVLVVDGVYGQKTRATVAVFQMQHGLPVTGRLDVVTLDKLEPMVPRNRLLAVIMNWVRESLLPEHRMKQVWVYRVKTCTVMIATLLILAASAVVFHFASILATSTRFLTRWLFTPSSSPWFTALRDNKVFLLSAQFAPALFIYFAALSIFPWPDTKQDQLPYQSIFQNWHSYISHLGLAYSSLVLMLVAFAVASAFDSLYNPDQQTENPIGAIVRASKRFVGLIGTLLICASLAGKSPFYIVGGLGAFMAVIMLVFRDYLLGLSTLR